MKKAKKPSQFTYSIGGTLKKSEAKRELSYLKIDAIYADGNLLSVHYRPIRTRSSSLCDKFYVPEAYVAYTTQSRV